MTDPLLGESPEGISRHQFRRAGYVAVMAKGKIHEIQLCVMYNAGTGERFEHIPANFKIEATWP